MHLVLNLLFTVPVRDARKYELWPTQTTAKLLFIVTTAGNIK